MTTARVQIHDEVQDGLVNTWRLCFQRVTYHYKHEDGSIDEEDGYRFIWRRPDNKLQGARGQARIQDADTLNRLLTSAKSNGWLK